MIYVDYRPVYAAPIYCWLLRLRTRSLRSTILPVTRFGRYYAGRCCGLPVGYVTLLYWIRITPRFTRYVVVRLRVTGTGDLPSDGTTVATVAETFGYVGVARVRLFTCGCR